MLRCVRCDKRLSRKSARMIDGESLCSTCMFAPGHKKSTRAEARVHHANSNGNGGKLGSR